jgi:hypothetical protein
MCCALALAAFFLRVEARHSAKYGFSQTIDAERGIAVPGGYVVANYPDFNRVDLDLRAYRESAHYDLTVHVREIHADQDDRTIQIDVAGAGVFHRKGAFANPFLTVRFDPIPSSAGKTYYVWVERGPRNQEDVITVWSIKSYSRVRAGDVVSAMLQRTSDTWGWFATGVLTLAGLLTLATSTVALAQLIASGRAEPTGAPRGC